MRKLLTTTALTLALVLTAGVSAASAKSRKPKHTAEHATAIKKCDADYKAALKEARAKRGAERKTAERDARATHKQCVDGAPM